MKISDAQVTRALQTFYRDFSSTDFDQDVEDAMRAVLEDALAAVPEPEYEWGYKSLGQDVVLTTEKYAHAMHERWGDKIVRRPKRGEWEEVEA